MSNASRSPEELAEMEGNLEDLKVIESEGFEGHAKGGADVKFVTQKEQGERKTKEASEVGENFARYVRENAELIGNPETYPTITYNQGAHADTVNFAKDRIYHKDWLTVIWTDHGEDEKFVVFTGPDNLTYKIVLRLNQIPGALNDIKDHCNNNMPTFLLKMFQHYFNTKSGVSVHHESHVLPNSSLVKLCQQMESKLKK